MPYPKTYINDISVYKDGAFRSLEENFGYDSSSGRRGMFGYDSGVFEGGEWKVLQTSKTIFTIENGISSGSTGTSRQMTTMNVRSYNGYYPQFFYDSQFHDMTPSSSTNAILQIPSPVIMAVCQAPYFQNTYGYAFITPSFPPNVLWQSDCWESMMTGNSIRYTITSQIPNTNVEDWNRMMRGMLDNLQFAFGTAQFRNAHKHIELEFQCVCPNDTIRTSVNTWLTQISNAMDSASGGYFTVVSRLS